MPKVQHLVLIESESLFRDSFHRFLNSHSYINVSLCTAKFDLGIVESKCDVLIFDLTKDYLRNIKLLQTISQKVPKTIKTLALSCPEHFNRNLLFSNYYNIDALFSKSSSDPYEIITAIRQLTAKNATQATIVGNLGNNNATALSKIDKPWSFSPSERRIIDEIFAEKQNRQIAHDLRLSIRTVESHRSEIIKRTKSKNMTGAILKILHQRSFL